jgi:hypothetical protein
MGLLLFILGMMVGGTVGVGVMCVLFWTREPEIRREFAKTCAPNAP